MANLGNVLQNLKVQFDEWNILRGLQCLHARSVPAGTPVFASCLHVPILLSCVILTKLFPTLFTFTSFSVGKKKYVPFLLNRWVYIENLKILAFISKPYRKQDTMAEDSENWDCTDVRQKQGKWVSEVCCRAPCVLCLCAVLISMAAGPADCVPEQEEVFGCSGSMPWELTRSPSLD